MFTQTGVVLPAAAERRGAVDLSSAVLDRPLKRQDKRQDLALKASENSH